MLSSKSGSFIAVAGEILKYDKWSLTKTQKANCDFSPIPDFVIKNSSRGPKHGASETQIMFFKAREMPKRARQPNHGGHPTFLARWYTQNKYRDSLAEHNIGKQEVLLHGRIALERNDFSATRAQNAKHWISRLNADGPQKPLIQRPEFTVALKQCQTRSTVRR